MTDMSVGSHAMHRAGILRWLNQKHWTMIILLWKC